MKRCTAEERALARATIYRLLALSFSYPTPEVRVGLGPALDVAERAAELIDEACVQGVAEVRAAHESAADPERVYQDVFTLSYSEDCPLYETAFSASHLFQQAQHQADIAGFYRAFGVGAHGDRPDHLAMELEFAYLLTLKEAWARDAGERSQVQTCRHASRSFLRDHLGRWAPLIGQRIVVTAAGSFYAAASQLLLSFIAWEQRFLRLPRIELYRDETVLIADEPGDMTCPVAVGAVASLSGRLPDPALVEAPR